MFKLFLAFILAVLATPAWSQDYQATTTSNAVIRQAPGPNYAQVGTIPAGTPVSVTVCFERGTYCLVSWAGEPASGFVAGELMTVGQTGQTVLSAEQARWQKIAEESSASRLPDFATIVSAEIRAEGDSYMAGAYDTRLYELIARATGRPVKNTAVGASEMTAVRDRILSPANSGLLRDLTIIWDGSNNGMTTVAAYADELEAAIKALGHDHFIVIPALHGGQQAQVAAEFKKRWPDNVLDWRTVLADAEGTIPEKYLASPVDDKVHLNDAAMGPMAEAIAGFITARGW